MRSDPPTFDSVAVLLRLLPTATMPNVTLLGFTVSCPGDVDCPRTENDVDKLEVSVVSVTVSCELPCVRGLYAISSDVLSPGASVVGSFSPAIVNSDLRSTAFLILIDESPLLTTVLLNTSVPPTVTVPKSNTAMLGVRSES